MRALVLTLALSACASPPDGLVSEAGDLSSSDETLTSGEFRDVYEVRARAGQWIKVDVLSNAFHPYLILRTPDGDQTDDDGATGRADRSVLVFQASEDGPNEVSVTSVDVGETGAYVLVYEVMDAPPAEAAGGSLPPGHPSVPGIDPRPTPRAAPGTAPRVGPPFTDEEIGEGVQI